MNHVSPVVLLIEHILWRIHENFLLVAHFDLEPYQRHVHLVVQYHAHLFKFETLKFVSFKRHSIQFVLCSSQIVKLPLIKLFDVFYSSDSLFHNLIGNAVCVCGTVLWILTARSVYILDYFIVYLFVEGGSRGVWSDQWPYHGDYARTDRTFSQKFQL